MPHEHTWVETEVGCEDCGSHSGLRCESVGYSDPGECDYPYRDPSWPYIDLVTDDDPREVK